MIITVVPTTTNAHNIIEESTQLSNLNTTSNEATNCQPLIPTNSLPTSTAPTTSPPDNTSEEATKPHPQNIVMTSDQVTISNQTPPPENSVPTSPPPDNKCIQDKEHSKTYPLNVTTSDEVTISNQTPPPENSVSTSPPPDNKCIQDKEHSKPHPPNVATSDKVTDNQAPLPTETSSSSSLTISSPDDTCTQDEKHKKPHPLNLVTIANKPKEAIENSSVPSSQVNRDSLLTENSSVTMSPKYTQDQECSKPHPQNLITSNKLDKGTDNSSVPSSPVSLVKEEFLLLAENITLAHITSPPECIPDIEHHDDDLLDLPIQHLQHLEFEQDPLNADDHENLEVEPLDIPPLIQPDNQPLLEPEFVYLTPAIQESGEDNMPPNIVVGSLPHLPHSMEDSLVYTCNNSYNTTTSDHSSNNGELVHY